MGAISVPLHLTGNTTDLQNSQLQTFLGAAAQEACRVAIGQLDQNRAQVVLDLHQKVQADVADAIVEIVHRHAISDRFKNEQVPSNRAYPATYKVRPIEAQVTELRKLFPGLGSCLEKLSRKPLPAGAEA
jgi:hypothetical protein